MNSWLLAVAEVCRGGMNTFFACVGILSIVFFGTFFLGCTHDVRRKRKPSHATKISCETQAIDSALGRRYLVHLEQQMAEFLSHHHHADAAILILLLVSPAITRAQEQPASPSQPSASTSAIPPAVAEELDAMKRRIEQLEAELKSRPASGSLVSAEYLVEPSHAQLDSTSNSHANPEGNAALSSQDTTPSKPAKPDPFSFADFTWLNGNSRVKEVPFQNHVLHAGDQVRCRLCVLLSTIPRTTRLSARPKSSGQNEFQVTQLGVGGDFHWDNVMGRIMTQFGMYSQTQPRNDASPARGQWTLDGAYRYLAEAYGGYHFNKMDGINVQAGIFMSYIGLFSWYNFDNWAYQPSYVSSNTPFFFNGMRVQIFPNKNLKIEPWLINGWQSYGRFNNRPGLGFQIL